MKRFEYARIYMEKLNDVEDFFKHWEIPGIYTMNYSDNYLIEIIGNIHDNPKYLGL